MWAPDGKRRLEILLFLSAMLAGLSGLISGDRAVDARQVERSAVAVSASVEAVAEAAEAASQAAGPSAPASRAFAVAAPARLSEAAAAPQAAPVDERRLE